VQSPRPFRKNGGEGDQAQKKKPCEGLYHTWKRKGALTRGTKKLGKKGKIGVFPKRIR